MPLDLEADMDLLLNQDDFAKAITLAGNAVSGIFDADYVFVDVGQAGMESVGPAVLVKSSDVAAYSITEGSAVVVDGVNYTVRDAQPDGITGGATLLRLRRA